jgi:hypothetical protein
LINKVISDLSGVTFNIGLKWGDPQESREVKKEQDYKVIKTSDVTKLDPTGKVITNESFNYHILDKSTGKPMKVSRDEFIKTGQTKAMKADKIIIDNKNKSVIAKFESFNPNK